ncbi:MAG TPA: BamA/TamA family outer membrane protein [Candidatus Angelobacter sp.]
MKPPLLSVALLWATLAAQPLCAAAQSFQAPCKTAQEFAALPPDSSTLTVQVKLQKGRLMVDATQTALKLSQRFLCTPNAISQDNATRILIGDLNSLFTNAAQFYSFGLTDSLQKQDQAGKLNDSETNNIRQFTGDWKNFLAAYNRWAAKIMPHSHGGIGTAFSKYTAALQEGTDLGALNPADGSSTFPPFDNPNSKKGILIFNVSDPISAWVDPLDPSTATNQFTVAIQGPISSKKAHDKRIHDLVQVLNPLQGHLWHRKEILDLLEDFYFPQGYTQPQVFLQSRTVTITESVSISRIVICPATIKPVTAQIVLYNLLSTGDFRQFLHNGSQFGSVSIPDPCRAFGYSPIHVPSLNYNVFQVQQAALSALGFNAAVSPSDSNGVATLIVRQGSSTAKATSGATGTAPKAATNLGASTPLQPVGSGTSTISAPLPSVAPVEKTKTADRATEENSPTPTPKMLNNFLGGGVDYRPGQGVRPFAIYSRQRLFSDQDSLTAKVGADGKALGELDYSSDFAFFGTLHHALSLRLTGASDFQQKRFLFGAATDERRTGAVLHASYEVFRDLNQMQLHLSIDGRQTRVILSPSGHLPLTTNVSTLDLGASFVLDQINGRFGRHLELNPNLRLGLALTNAEPSYQTGTLTAMFQQNLPGLYQLHFNGKTQTGSGNTPIFELPSFGGDDSVRGFRHDDGLGRRVVSLQSELWSPIPGVTNNSGKVGQFLHRNVWLAGFFDAGGIFQAVDQVTGAREGTGLGARVNYKLVIFKLDWAYGFGTGRTGDGRGRFYFSITNWLPL